ncbi:MAG TPA: HU family DNA-binding protein [Acidimicrobiales bacterium]|nr:HU family DNA-binding protein [Acidimicrobiales bacterium]
MNKSDVIDRVAGAAGVARQQAESVLDAFFETVRSATKGGDRVAWPGFGSFRTTQRKARTGRNPRTGESVRIPATKAVKFSPSSALKDYLNTGSGSKRAAGGAKKAGAARAGGKTAGARKAAPAKAATTRSPARAGAAKSAKKATKTRSR